jgi:hypothetical protein
MNSSHTSPTSPDVKETAATLRHEAIKRLNTDFDSATTEGAATLLTTKRQKRPRAVWVIFIWNIFSDVFVLLVLWAIYFGGVHLKPATADYFNNLTIVEHLFTATLIVLNLIGTIAFFLLKKISVPILFTALAFNVLRNLIEIFFPRLPITSSLVISFIICMYALRLRNNGVLS